MKKDDALNVVVVQAYRDYLIETLFDSNPEWLEPLPRVVEGEVVYGARSYSIDGFIERCRVDPGFSQRWGLTVDWVVIPEDKRYNLWFNNNYETGMERFFNPDRLPDYSNPYYDPTPDREVVVSFRGSTVSYYE
jgi:hypothetical protein